MNSTLENSMRTPTQSVDQPKETGEQAPYRARSAILDGLRFAASLFVALRGIGLGDALGRMSFQRRRSSATSLATFGVGFLAGAAAGILFAPLSGAEMRRSIVEAANTKQAESRPGVSCNASGSATRRNDCAPPR